MRTQLLTAIALQGDEELRQAGRYMFSFQIDSQGHIRIITTDDIERYYADIHHFLSQWTQVSSLGVAENKEAFLELLDTIKRGATGDVGGRP